MQQENSGLLSMRKILLKKYFCDSARANLNTRPLIRELSTLLGDVSEGLGYLAMLGDSLSRMQSRSSTTKDDRETILLQASLLHASLRSMESVLTDLLISAEESGTGGS
jgi:hypothetical protein